MVSMVINGSFLPIDNKGVRNMEIKNNKFKPGDIIQWELEAPETLDNGIAFQSPRSRLKKTDLVVKEVYKHHILCMRLEFPYDKVSLTYQQLFLGGLIKSTDFKNPFAVRATDG